MRRHNMELKYLEDKLEECRKTLSIYAFNLYSELNKIKSELDKVNVPDFDKYSAMFTASIPEQIKRLKENEPYRSGWDNLKLDYCLEKIEENINCIDMISGDDLDDDLKGMIYHLADIANYANMAILKCKNIIDGKVEYDK
jgi:hypothetical protein